MNIKLIGNKVSPFVRRVEIVLRELGLSYDFQLDYPWEPNSVAGTYNPIGKIPIVIIDRERVLFDSSIITDFLLKIVPTELSNGTELINNKLLMTVVDDALDTAVLYSWELKRAKDKIDLNVLEKYEKRIKSCLRYMDSFYSSEKIQFSVFDIMMVCCIDYLLLRQFFQIQENDYHYLFSRRKKLYERQSIKVTSPLSFLNNTEQGQKNA